MQAHFPVSQRAITPAASPTPTPVPRPALRLVLGGLSDHPAKTTKKGLCEPNPATPLSLEERFCAAAYRILTDGYRHSPEVQTWALRYLAQSAPGRDHTSFIRQAVRRAPLAADRRSA